MENGKDSNEERKLPEWKNKKISKRRKKCPMVHWGGDNVRCGTQGASFLLRRNQFDNFVFSEHQEVLFAEKEAFHKRKREQLQNEKGWKLNTENQDKEIIAKLTVHTEKRRKGPKEQCVRFSTCCAGGNKNKHCVYITPSKSKLSKNKNTE